MANKALWIGIVIVIVVIATSAFFMLGKTSRIIDIKNEANIGQTVAVKGTVQTTVKIGELSGYTLSDGTETIAVSSQQLPQEGETITVRGTLIKDTILGYYIKVN